MSSASERLSLAMIATCLRSRGPCYAQRRDACGLRRTKHHRFPFAIKRALRSLVSDVADDDAIGFHAFAFQPTREFEPFGAFHAQAVSAAVEHFNVVGCATA